MIRNLNWDDFSIYLFTEAHLNRDGNNEYCYMSRFRYLKGWFERNDIDFDKRGVNQFFNYLQTKSLRNNTLNNFLKLIKHVCEYLNLDFMRKYHYFPSQPYPINVLTPTELRNLINCYIPKKYCTKKINLKYSCAITLMVVTGLRVSELCDLKWKDLVPYKIIIEHSKNRTSREVPISSELYNKINKLQHFSHEYIFGSHQGRMMPISVNRELKRRAEKCGIQKRIYPHVLRHSFITSMIMKNPKACQIVVGHKRIESTMHYYHPEDKEILEFCESNPIYSNGKKIELFNDLLDMGKDIYRKTGEGLKLANKYFTLKVGVKNNALAKHT